MDRKLFLLGFYCGLVFAIFFATVLAVVVDADCAMPGLCRTNEGKQ